MRDYEEDPSIGLERVETLIDAAHALSMNCRRNPAIRKLTPEEQRQRRIEAAEPRHDPFARLHRRPDYVEPDLRQVPLEPEEDILLFIRDHNRHLEAWEQDLLTIIHEEAQYFLPQIETKIMNEGWASYWHHKIMNSLELPQEIYLEFLVRHNQVICPHPGSINPYHVGFKIWHDIERRCDDPTAAELEAYGPPSASGRDKIFEVRESDRDASFLRRFLTEELMRELDLFEYEPRGDNLVVTKVADEDSWREVKETLIKTVGMNAQPVIRIYDADYGNNRALYLEARARRPRSAHRLRREDARLPAPALGSPGAARDPDEGQEDAPVLRRARLRCQADGALSPPRRAAPGRPAYSTISLTSSPAFRPSRSASALMISKRRSAASSTAMRRASSALLVALVDRAPPRSAAARSAPPPPRSAARSCRRSPDTRAPRRRSSGRG